MLYLWSVRLAVGWKILVTAVLGLCCLREGKKNTGHVWLLDLPDGLRSLGRAGWSQPDSRRVFSLQIGVCPFQSQKGNWYVGRWDYFRAGASSCFDDCPDHFFLRWTPLGTWLTGALAAGSRASRTVWVLSHWECCYPNSTACFGGGKMGILDRRPALYVFVLPHPLQSWQTARSNFVFLQIHIQDKSMAATWLWLMNVFESVVMNKTLKVKFFNGWMFSFIFRLCFCRSSSTNIRQRTSFDRKIIDFGEAHRAVLV